MKNSEGQPFTSSSSCSRERDPRATCVPLQSPCSGCQQPSADRCPGLDCAPWKASRPLLDCRSELSPASRSAHFSCSRLRVPHPNRAPVTIPRRSLEQNRRLLRTCMPSRKPREKPCFAACRFHPHSEASFPTPAPPPPALPLRHRSEHRIH